MTKDCFEKLINPKVLKLAKKELGIEGELSLQSIRCDLSDSSVQYGKRKYYRHFKGNVYVIEKIIFDATLNVPKVSYRKYNDNAGIEVFSRTFEDFFDSNVEKSENSRRFTLLNKLDNDEEKRKILEQYKNSEKRVTLICDRSFNESIHVTDKCIEDYLEYLCYVVESEPEDISMLKLVQLSKLKDEGKLFYELIDPLLSTRFEGKGIEKDSMLVVKSDCKLTENMKEEILIKYVVSTRSKYFKTLYFKFGDTQTAEVNKKEICKCEKCKGRLFILSVSGGYTENSCYVAGCTKCGHKQYG